MANSVVDLQKQELEKPIETIKALGEKSKIAIIPREYILPWLVIVFISYILVYKPLQYFFGVGYFWLVLVIVWFCIAWALIAGRRSHHFTDEFYSFPGHNWIDTPNDFIPATSNMFQKQIKKKQRTKKVVQRTGIKEKEQFNPFQNESELHGNMLINLGGQSFATILRCNEFQEWSSSIPLTLQGLHPQQPASEIINISKTISESLKDIPKGESICIVLGCRSRFQRRIDQLSELVNTEFPIIGIMHESEKLKVEEITNLGLRQEWHHYALLNWSQRNQDIRENSDTISLFINATKNSFKKFFRGLLGTEAQYLRNAYVKLAKDIYSNAFLPWTIRLESNAKLNISSLNHQEAFELIARRFDNEIYANSAHEVPQAIHVAEVQGKVKHRVVVNNPYSKKDLLSKVIEGRNGLSSCPNHDMRRDRIRLREDLVAILKLEMPPDKVPFGDQLYWVWDRIKDQAIKDTDIFLEISPGDKAESNTNLKRLVRQSSHANSYAKSKGNILSVDATSMSDEAIAAQQRLHSGAQPLIVSFTIHVYRKTDADLNIACRRLIEVFSPGKLIREDKVCWRRWLESLPINNQRIQTSTTVFNEPRITVDTESIRTLLPLVRPRDIHSQGVEFINIEGGAPIYIDLVENCQRGIITGGTGSGKTVMAFAHIKQALSRKDRACVGIDMSNEGEGTLKPIMELLGEDGAYINLVEESFNILQPPDLRRHEPKIQKRRTKIWLESRKKIITSFVLGSNPNPSINPDIISAIVTIALDTFINDVDIVHRYNAALEAGWNTPEWENMPVLEDFLFFCSKEKLNLSDFGSKQVEALDLIVTNIQAKLVDPNIGECIANSSTVSPKARLQFFGLSGLSDANNAYILSLVAQGACLNASLEYTKSLMVIDECPALFEKPGFTEMVGMQFSLGRKEGVSALLIGQNMEAITQCKNSTQIIRNTDFHFVGKISSDGIAHYAETLGMRPEDLTQNAGDTFGINKQRGCSQWLIYHSDRYWITSYYPSRYELAGLANSADEKIARQKIMSKFPKTPKGRCLGLVEYARTYK